MISRLNLYDENGNQINIESIGLFGLKLSIPSPSYSMETQKIDGGGIIVVDKQLESRSLDAEFMTIASSYDDMLNQKFELYALLGNGKEFYIEQANRKGIVWKCHLADWSPEQIGTQVTNFSIPLNCVNGYSETLNEVKKKYTTSNFVFKNEGNLLINPSKHSETEIKFKGTSTNLKITNNTTGDVWSYTGSTLSTDSIILKGINSMKNGASIFKNTNKKIITITTGNNEFTLSGATGSFELVISTRFYFL